MRFFTGLHQPSDAKHFDAAFVSVNRIRNRKKSFDVGDWIMDSGAFSELSRENDLDDFGNVLPNDYREHVSSYARQIIRWKENGNLLAAVSQDYMYESFILKKTGLTLADHQRLTIERYDALLACDTGVYILPVLQGFSPEDYVKHIRTYGDRLKIGMWVGVGSICKRNGNIRAIEDILLTIRHERPDLRLHGFGLKTTALSSGLVQDLLETADSMAWSFAARISGRNGNDWREAESWGNRIKSRSVQPHLFIPEIQI